MMTYYFSTWIRERGLKTRMYGNIVKRCGVVGSSFCDPIDG